MEFLPSELRKLLPKLHDMSGPGDPTAFVRYYLPDMDWSWFLLAYDGYDECLVCEITFVERFSYYSLRELESLHNVDVQFMRRDLAFTPQPLSVARHTYGRYSEPTDTDTSEVAYFHYLEIKADYEFARDTRKDVSVLKIRCQDARSSWLALINQPADTNEADPWLLTADELQPYLYVLSLTHRLCPSVAAWQFYMPNLNDHETFKRYFEPSSIDELRERLSWLVDYHFLSVEDGCCRLTPRGRATVARLEQEIDEGDEE